MKRQKKYLILFIILFISLFLQYFYCINSFINLLKIL